MRTQIPLRLHWVRHGKVSSHQGDVPVTEDGLEQAEEVGIQLAEEVSPDEDIFFLYAPTRRTRARLLEAMPPLRPRAHLYTLGNGSECMPCVRPRLRTH